PTATPTSSPTATPSSTPTTTASPTNTAVPSGTPTNTPVSSSPPPPAPTSPPTPIPTAVVGTGLGPGVLPTGLPKTGDRGPTGLAVAGAVVIGLGVMLRRRGSGPPRA